MRRRDLLSLACSLLGIVACREQPAPASEPRPSAAQPAPSAPVPPAAAPLRIAYSDWPGWVAWDIAEKKGFFRAEGVDVELVWLEYVPSMEHFSQGKVDAVCMTNGDALVVAQSGAQSTGILLNDYSNGNDMIVARPGLSSVKELKGKRIGVEVGFVDHLLLLEALKSVGLKESDVEIVNEKTNVTPALLASGRVDAIAAWQPNSGQALEQVKGARALFTSADVPGLIYDLLYVNPKSLSARRADWQKVVNVWFDVVSYIQSPTTRADAVHIMSERVALPAAKYATLLQGTFLLDRAGNLERFREGPSLASVYGSSRIVDGFNIANHIYKDPSLIETLLDPSLVRSSPDRRR
jgi:NitT/TauT family transport system substrate-binding protein